MNIILIEDDHTIAESISKGLSQHDFMVTHFADGKEGFEALIQQNFDALVVDVMLPSMNGLEIVEKIRAVQNTVPTIILSAKKTVDDRINGLQVGADDYLTKPFHFNELLLRLQAITRRQAPQITTTLKVRNLEINIIDKTLRKDGELIELEPREFSLLEYLAKNKDVILSREMIMKNAWNYSFDPNTNVIEARMCHLRRKIETADEKKFIRTVRGLGYVLES